MTTPAETSNQGVPAEVAVVTGSGSGVGRAVALAFAARGAAVVVNAARSRDAAEETAGMVRAAGGRAVVVMGDIASDEDCRRIAAGAEEAFGRIDRLINNAGTTRFCDHADLDGLQAQDFLDLYAVNVVGAFQMTRACAPALKRSGSGAVVNVSSIAGIAGVGSSVAYAASKGALNTMTLSLARVLGPEIRVNAVCPGFIEGRWLREGMGADRYDAQKAKLEKTTPLRRVAAPEDVARAILALVDTPHVTGETLMVDGGAHLFFTPLVAR